MKLKLFVSAFFMGAVSVAGLLFAAQQAPQPVPQTTTAQTTSQPTQQPIAAVNPQPAVEAAESVEEEAPEESTEDETEPTEEEPTEEEPAEEEPVAEEAASEPSESEEQAVPDAAEEEAVQEEPTEEESATEEESVGEESAEEPAEEEPIEEPEEEAEEETSDEEEPEEKVGFVSKWEDAGFDFSELEAAPLPEEIAKEQPEVMPEVAELDVSFDNLDEIELRYVDKSKAPKKLEGLVVQLPIIGDIALEPVMIDEEHGYKFSSLPGRSVNAGVLIIDKYTMTLVGTTVSFTGEGSLLGKRGKLYLKQFTPNGLVPAVNTPAGVNPALISSATPAPKETKGDVDQMIFSFVYDNKEQPKIAIPNLGDMMIKSTDIIFQKDRPILIIAKAQIFGVNAEVGLALTTMRVNALINVQATVKEKCKDPALQATSECQDLTFADVIPQIGHANASIGKSKIKDLILKINNLIVLKAAQKLIKTNYYDQDLLTGVLTATINLLGTDLAANPKAITKYVSKRPTKSSAGAEAVPLNPWEAEIEMNFSRDGYQGTLTAGTLYIKDVGTIENPTIETTLSSGTASIIIQGALVIPLQDLQPLRISPINIELSNDGLAVSGLIPEFTYEQIQFTNLKVEFNTLTRSINLESSKRFGDFELKIIFGVIKGSADDDTKNGLSLTAKLVSTSICSQRGFACRQEALKVCAASEPEKKKAIEAKEKLLKEKETQALALTAAGKESEADAAWTAWEKLDQELFKEKTDLIECVTQARNKCASQESSCESDQRTARAQATGRADVEQVRAELKEAASGKKGAEVKKPAIEEISFYPFKDIPTMPAELKDIRLTDIDVSIGLTRGSTGPSMGALSFKGKVHAFGVVVPGTLKLIYAGENKGGMVLTIDFEERTTLAKLAPFALNSSPYNTIYLESPKVVISTLSTAGTGGGTTVSGDFPKGVHISGKVPLSGGLADVGKLLGQESKLFNLTGSIDWSDLQRSQISIAIMQDSSGLTTQEKCKKASLDCVKEKTAACDAVAGSTSEQKATCKEDAKKACATDLATCEKGLNEIFRLSSVSIDIKLKPEMSVSAGMLLRPPMQKDKPIELNGGITLGVDKATIHASMKGTWYDAFDLKGWELSNLAVTAGQKYGSPLPSELGGAGRIKIVGKSLTDQAEYLTKQIGSLSAVKDVQKELASKPIFSGKTAQEAEKVASAAVSSFKKTIDSINLEMEAAVNVDLGFTDMALEFKTTKVITWSELLVAFCASFFESMGNKELVAQLAFIDTLLLKISDFHGSYSPKQDITIGVKTIPRGMALGFTVDLWGKKGRCKMRLANDGLEGLATFDKIDTPYFKLTGAGEDKILGTPDDAPIMRVNLNLLKQEFYVDGEVQLIIPQLGTIKSLTRVNIGFDECRFLTQANVFNLFSADLEAKIGNDPKDIYIKGKMQQSALNQFEKLLKDAARSLNEQARRDIEYAKTQVRTLSSAELTANNRRALKQAKDNVQYTFQDLNALKSKLDAVVRACGS